jgi:hypothetical protein
VADYNPLEHALDELDDSESEVTRLREQARALTADLAATQAKFNGAADACLTLGTRVTQAESAVRALTADNAALLEIARGVPAFLAQACAALRPYGINAEFTPAHELIAALAAEHPGAAMLAEMESIKSTLDAAGVPSTPGECEVDERPLTLGERVALLVRSRDNRSAEAGSLRARVAKLEAEHAEDQCVIRVWRGRTERAEAERDAAHQRVKHATKVARVALLSELAKENREAAAIFRDSLPERAAHHDAIADGYDAQATKEENTPEEG